MSGDPHRHERKGQGENGVAEFDEFESIGNSLQHGERLKIKGE
jgi:hypothetical protein